MFTYEDRIKAVKLLIKYDMSYSDVIEKLDIRQKRHYETVTKKIKGVVACTPSILGKTCIVQKKEIDITVIKAILRLIHFRLEVTKV